MVVTATKLGRRKNCGWLPLQQNWGEGKKQKTKKKRNLSMGG
jgi:hypothetical protein